MGERIWLRSPFSLKSQELDLTDEINEVFPDEMLFQIGRISWYANMCKLFDQFHHPQKYSQSSREENFQSSKALFLGLSISLQMGSRSNNSRCVLEEEKNHLLEHCHSPPYVGLCSNQESSKSSTIIFLLAYIVQGYLCFGEEM